MTVARVCVVCDGTVTFQRAYIAHTHYTDKHREGENKLPAQTLIPT